MKICTSLRVQKNEKRKLTTSIYVELDEIFDKSILVYYKSEVEDCVLYYICGFVTKNFTKNIKCNICPSAINGLYHLIKNSY